MRKNFLKLIRAKKIFTEKMKLSKENLRLKYNKLKLSLKKKNNNKK